MSGLGLVEAFQLAGRTIFSLGLVKDAEGNLSVFDGRTLVITRTGAELRSVGAADLVEGSLEGDLPGASADLEVHRAMYRTSGPGAVVHAHPPGTVPERGGGPGRHGVYRFAPSLHEAVEMVVRAARADGAGEREWAHGPVEASAQAAAEIRAIEWRDGIVRYLDQTRLPVEERYVEVSTAAEVAEAIAKLAIRGAPLLGIAAGFGLALEGSRQTSGRDGELLARLGDAGAMLVRTRPTAVNIAWAVDRVLAAASAVAGQGDAAVAQRVTEEALGIQEEDRVACRSIGAAGEPLIPAGANVLTHCNTGSLATGGEGTAQAVIVAAHRAGKGIHVWVDETRPLLQGARLTAWELQRLGIPMTLVVDGAAGSLMARGLVDVVVVGADRIAANGDVANKVGTYQLAVLARHHGIPFHVAAPVSTVDLATPTGQEIAVEERDPREVTTPFGVAFAPAHSRAANPAFDLTPAGLVTSFVTDRGVARPPFDTSLRELAGGRRHLVASP